MPLENTVIFISEKSGLEKYHNFQAEQKIVCLNSLVYSPVLRSFIVINYSSHIYIYIYLFIFIYIYLYLFIYLYFDSNLPFNETEIIIFKDKVAKWILLLFNYFIVIVSDLLS